MTLSKSLWVVGRAHIQAFTCSWRWLSRSQSLVRRAQMQAFEQKKLAHMCRTPWSVSRNNNNERTEKIICHCLGAWDWWSGRVYTSVGRTHETTDTWDNREGRWGEVRGNFWGCSTPSSAVHQAQCNAPLQVGHRRCGCRVHRHRYAVECRLCHCLTLLSWPILADPPQSALAWCAWRRVHRGHGLPRPLRRPLGNRHRCGRAIDTIWCSRPGFCRTGPWLRELPIRSKTGAEPSNTVRASVSVACVWMQLLKLRKTARSQGCKDEVLCGWMKMARREGQRLSWRSGWSRCCGCWPCHGGGSTLVLACPGSPRRPGRSWAARSSSWWPSRSLT